MECGAAAAASFALCTGLYGAADACSSRWHPPTYAADKPERRILWNTTAVAVYPGLVVPWLALAGSRQFYAEAGLTMVGPANRWLWLALGLSLGYMAFDTVMMLWYRGPLRKALRPALYQQLLWHHGLSLLIWPYAFAGERAVLAVAYFLFTEVSNIFLNTRWFMAEMGITGPVLVAVNALLFVTYTLVRIVPVPGVLYALWRSDWAEFSGLQRLVSTTILIPLALNLFWYSLMVKGLRAVLRGGAKANAQP
eukprot:EG_transcript_19492